MIEILEKVSEQVEKNENICSGSMPALDGEYYTPIFSGQEPVPSTEGIFPDGTKGDRKYKSVCREGRTKV